MAYPPAIADLRKLTSTQINSTGAGVHNAYLGDFSNALIGVRSPIDIQVSDVAGDVFQKRKVAIRGFMRADFVLGRNNDIVRLHGFTAST